MDEISPYHPEDDDYYVVKISLRQVDVILSTQVYENCPCYCVNLEDRELLSNIKLYDRL